MMRTCATESPSIAADQGIRLIAYRPLGGDRVSGSRAMRPTVARRREALQRDERGSSARVAYDLRRLTSCRFPARRAWRRHRRSGALGTRRSTTKTARSSMSAFPDACCGCARAERRPGTTADGEVVVGDGHAGAGKTASPRAGWRRDSSVSTATRGGSFADLTHATRRSARERPHRVVLDNTYPTRKPRERSHRSGVGARRPVRCIWLTTDVADAQINSIQRMIEVHGSLPSPDEIRERRQD